MGSSKHTKTFFRQIVLLILLNVSKNYFPIISDVLKDILPQNSILSRLSELDIAGPTTPSS